MMKLTICAAVAALALGLAAPTFAATNASGTLTADNAFDLYTGNLSGSDLQWVGSGNNWTTASTVSFNVSPGDYLYVLAVDWGQPHAWQGAFSTPSGKVYTNAASWTGATVLGATVDAAMIASASWGPINTDLAPSSGPWGNVVNNAGADWIWTSGTNSNDMRVLFRSANPVAAVPEAGTFGTMALGLGALAWAARRRQRKS